MKVKPANQPNAKLARKEKQSTQKGKTEQLSASDESEADEEEEDDEDEEEEDEAEEDHAYEGRKDKNKRRLMCSVALFLLRRLLLPLNRRSRLKVQSTRWTITAMLTSNW